MIGINNGEKPLEYIYWKAVLSLSSFLGKMGKKVIFITVQKDRKT
jgi:hypothetical protein